MEGRIFLSENKYSEFDYMVELDLDYGYCISIATDLDEPFENLIIDSRDLGESIDVEIGFSEMINDETSEENICFLKKIREQKEEYLLNASYVGFDFDLDRIIDYIKKNPILKKKKIIISESIGLNYSILNKIYLELNGEVSNLYFKLSDNLKLVNFKECLETYRVLENMINDIDKYNFSPLEKIMYVYDLVRNRIYLDVSQDDDKSKSRDLSSSLLGNNIVCLGFARIFNALLEKIGIKTREVLLFDSSNKTGHARNEIYIKDDKYGIDGVYYFDATWDSKKKENDISYLSSYKYFAKTKTYMDDMDCGKIIDTRFPCFSSTMDYEFMKTVEQQGFNKISKEMIRSINHMSSLINGKYLIDMMVSDENSPFYGRINVEEVTEQLSELVYYFDKPISANVLLEVLYNVRKIQYYIEPDKFPFSFEEFYKTMKLSNWGFEGNNPKERMLVAIFGEYINTRKHMDRYDETRELSKSIEQVKLTKTLRKVYENKLKK